MPRDEHNKAAEHHENAAKNHRTAAEHHGKCEHGKGREELAEAYGQSKTAHEHSEMAHGRSQSQKYSGSWRGRSAALLVSRLPPPIARIDQAKFRCSSRSCSSPKSMRMNTIRREASAANCS